MDDRPSFPRSGCAQAAAIAALILWLVTAIVCAALLGSLLPAGRAAATLALAAILLLPPFLAAVLLARRRPGWSATAGVAAALTAITGYLLLDAAVRGVLPAEPRSVLHTRETWAAALRLALLVPYTLLAALFVPRLAGASPRRLKEWLGLEQYDGATLLLALASAALLTLPWPLTGALGDRLTSLGLAFQALAWAVPPLLLFWGLLYALLRDRLVRPWAAALLAALLYALSALGEVLPAGDWGAAANSVLLLPLALLLAELRARPGGLYPLLLVAFAVRAAPLLFVDPRDVLAQGGIPEMQHVISHAIALTLTVLLALALWVERNLLTLLQERVRLPGWSRIAAATLAALTLWGAWAGLYAFAGEPGFADDGFLIILEEQADLSGIPPTADRQARLQAVHDALVATAEATQAPLRAELERLGVPYRPYYIINMIRVDGHRWLMGHFARQPGVAQVILNPNVRRYPRRLTLPQYGVEGESLPAVQDNLAAIHADQAWALGVTGEGIVVAGQDTGYDWTHPALLPHYRGQDGQHDFNWHDAWDHTAVPFDEDGHGTHTMGIILGDDGAGNRTGVAPGAQWIGCRNMRRGFGNPGAYAECMEFFLAPYPHGGDPFRDGDVSRAPHLVNNSWGCPDIEGCAPDTLQRAVEALRAAGIMMVVSAGNEGPGCETVTDPPANYDAVFSVGATDNGGQIVGFSSRGPADGRIKPDVSAPGSNVRSTLPGGEYGLASGTSMAGPHVAGLVALLWSADPRLIRDIEGTERLICQTAAPRPVEQACTADTVPTSPFAALFANPICACGEVTGVPNNVYGCGFINAGAAVQAVR